MNLLAVAVQIFLLHHNAFARICYEGDTVNALPAGRCSDFDACMTETYRTMFDSNRTHFKRYCVDANACDARGLLNSCFAGNEIMSLFYESFIKKLKKESAMKSDDEVIESMFCCCNKSDLCNYQYSKWLSLKTPPANLSTGFAVESDMLNGRGATSGANAHPFTNALLGLPLLYVVSTLH